MNTLLAIDPGKSSGYAIFRGGCLARAGCVLSPRNIGDCDEVAIEVPQSYPGEPVPARVLSELNILVGMWLALHAGAKVARYFPRDWKGQLPKAIGNARTLAALDPDEVERIEYPRSAKGRTDVLDAIGIGLVHTGRLRRGLVNGDT